MCIAFSKTVKFVKKKLILVKNTLNMVQYKNNIIKISKLSDKVYLLCLVTSFLIYY